MDYYANVGPDRGTALYRDTPPATDVLDSRGGKMALFGPNEMVAQVLKTSAIDTVIPVYNDLETAVAALQ